MGGDKGGLYTPSRFPFSPLIHSHGQLEHRSRQVKPSRSPSSGSTSLSASQPQFGFIVSVATAACLPRLFC